MNFRISGLPLDAFASLFKLTDEELAERGVVRRIADRRPGFPCRVSLQDAGPGERVLLLNYEHQPAQGPYRSRHAIYVRENAIEAHPEVNEVPNVLRSRLLSVRAFDTAGFMVHADVTPGEELGPVLARMFDDAGVAYVHLHNAKPGCYAARADRA